MAGVDDGVIRQREEPSPDRVDDQVGVREGPACRARPTLEQGVAGDHRSELGDVPAHRAGGMAGRMQAGETGNFIAIAIGILLIAAGCATAYGIKSRKTTKGDADESAEDNTEA